MSENIIFESYTVDRKLPNNYIKGELEFCRKEFSYNTSDVELIDCEGVFVNHKGFVYDGYFKIHKKSLLSPDHYKGYFNLKHFIKKVLLKKKKTTDPNERYLLAFDEWGAAHYHWFCDTLPRIYSAKDILKDYYLLLPGNSSYIKEVGLKTLELLELVPKGIKFINEKDLLAIEHLTIVTHACAPGYINDKITRRISEGFLKPLKNRHPKPTRKLYISREGAAFRKVLNEDKVQELVKSFGYEIIKYEDMSLQEQMYITASARSIVSLHGAGLTNIMFMQKGGSVLEFRRNRIYHNQCYWHLAGALRLNFFYLFGAPDNESLVLEGNGCNLTIDVKKLAKTLERMDESATKFVSILGE